MTKPVTIDPEIAVSDPEILARLCKIDLGDGSVPDYWDPWPHQIELWRTMRGNRKVIVLKARQLGITWAMALFALWIVLVYPSVNVLIVSVGEREAQQVLLRINRLYQSLPEIVKAAFPLKKSTEEQMVVEHPEGPSTIWSLPSSSSAGRGLTVKLLIADEAAHWPNPEQQMASLGPTYGDVGQVVMASTANGLNYFYDTWESAQAETDAWAPLFHNATARPDRDIAWVERERAERKELGPQEYPLTPHEAFISSGGMAVPADVIADYMDNCVRPYGWKGHITRDALNLLTRADPQGDWEVWEWPEPGREYFISADVCGGGGGTDYSYAIVWDATSLTQVAAYHARPEPREFATELIRAGYLYRSASGPALLVPESNNHGQGVISTLLERRYPRIYHREVENQRENATRRQLGFATSWQSRTHIIASLQGAMRDGIVGLRDRRILRELSRFIEVDKGGGTTKYEASTGHDDCVIAAAIGAHVGLNSRQVTTAAQKAVGAPRGRVEASGPYWGAAA